MTHIFFEYDTLISGNKLGAADDTLSHQRAVDGTRTRATRIFLLYLHPQPLAGAFVVAFESPVYHSASRAVDGTRTRDPRLGKPMLYQLSYYRKIDEMYNPQKDLNYPYTKNHLSANAEAGAPVRC